MHPREIARTALALHELAAILSHNHPNSDPAPSRADEALTKTIKAAPALVDVRVLDRIITASGTRHSMVEAGLM